MREVVHRHHEQRRHAAADARAVRWPAAAVGPGSRPFDVTAAVQTIGRYTVLRELGSGAMGVVWLAHDPNLDRDVAIKVLAVRTREADFVRRFLQEARLAAKLHHANTVTVHDVGAEGDQAYMVMELVEGESLEKATAPDRPMEWREATRRSATRPWAWRQPTNWGWSTATSSPRTSCGPSRARRRSVTSACAVGVRRNPLHATGDADGHARLHGARAVGGHGGQSAKRHLRPGPHLLFLLTGKIPFSASQPVLVGHQHLHTPLPDPRTSVAGLPDAACRVHAAGSGQARQTDMPMRPNWQPTSTSC